MKRLACLLFVLFVSGTAVAAENYYGDYAWLRFWNAKITTSASHEAAYLYTGWLGHRNNTGDHWYQIQWDDAMRLSGARMQVWAQVGTNGSVGEYKLQYTLDSNPTETSQWIDIETTQYGTSTPVTLSSTGDYFVSFQNMPSTGVKAVRVFFPQGSYTLGTANVQSGPGVVKFLPIGNLANG